MNWGTSILEKTRGNIVVEIKGSTFIEIGKELIQDLTTPPTAALKTFDECEGLIDPYENLVKNP